MTQKVKDYSYLDIRGDVNQFFELRMENDGNGNPIYIGYTRQANAPTSEAVWFIVKITYDANQSPTYQQLPNAGVNFNYVWDSRATYF